MDDLVAMLQAMGAKSSGRLRIGSRSRGWTGARGRAPVLGDRLEAGTFAMAAAVTGGRSSCAASTRPTSPPSPSC